MVNYFTYSTECDMEPGKDYLYSLEMVEDELEDLTREWNMSTKVKTLQQIEKDASVRRRKAREEKEKQARIRKLALKSKIKLHVMADRFKQVDAEEKAVSEHEKQGGEEGNDGQEEDVANVAAKYQDKLDEKKTKRKKKKKITKKRIKTKKSKDKLPKRSSPGGLYQLAPTAFEQLSIADRRLGNESIKQILDRGRTHNRLLRESSASVDTKPPATKAVKRWRDAQRNRDPMPALCLSRDIKHHSSYVQLTEIRSRKLWHQRLLSKVKANIDMELPRHVKIYQERKKQYLSRILLE